MKIIEGVLWGDVLFAIDFSMDYLCLYFCLRIQRREIQTLRLCLGAAIGAAFSVASIALAPHFTTVTKTILSLVFAYLCCLVALPPCHTKALRTLMSMPLFFIFEAALGGIMTAIYLWFGKQLGTYTYKTSGAEDSYGIPTFFLILVIAFVLFFFFYRVITSRHREEPMPKDVRLLIKYQKKSAILPCFFDSGNFAREPISGEAVIFLPTSAEASLSLSGAQLSSGGILGSRLIPIQTISGRQLLWGILPDELYLMHGEQVKRISAYLVFSDNGKEDTAILPQTQHFMTFSY